MIEKIWCSSCPHPCYFEIRFAEGDPKTKSFLRCPLGFSPDFFIADKPRHILQIRAADQRQPEWKNPGPAPARPPATLEPEKILDDSNGGPCYGNAERPGSL